MRRYDDILQRVAEGKSTAQDAELLRRALAWPWWLRAVGRWLGAGLALALGGAALAASLVAGVWLAWLAGLALADDLRTLAAAMFVASLAVVAMGFTAAGYLADRFL